MSRRGRRPSVDRDVRTSAHRETPELAQVRDAIAELEREGEPMRFLHSMIVAADESFLCVVEAASEELVHAAYERASVPYERISAALTEPTY
jgi:hypothetical protein